MPRARAKAATRKRATKSTATGRSKASSKRSATAARGSGAETFVCSECGKSFTRAASLGAHRNRAHGVAGAASRATQRRRRSAAGGRGAGVAGGGRVDRDALLSALFPNGIPARESVIREVNAWLDQAEKLARQGTRKPA